VLPEVGLMKVPLLRDMGERLGMGWPAWNRD